jgi:multidrug efflux pump subunit AcrB
VLVSFVNELRAQGVEVWEALTRAAELRFRPVLLTTVTTIFGILPLTLNLSGGGEFWVPLGVSLIFGIATASFLTLLVIPVMYSMLYRKQIKSYLSKNSAPPEKKVDEVP